MSYLNSLRLHFAGQFQANISTVNNEPANFCNDSFQATALEQGEGNYSPQGDGAWRLLGCKVTAAWLPSGRVRWPDPVLKCIIADSNSQAPAKLVDLDPEQQMVSEIWGLQVRIADAKGKTLLTGDFEPAAFMDIWDRGNGNESAMYQSVLSNLHWADVSRSKFLTQLQQETKEDGLLSIKFNLDNFGSHMCGRIVGTIGPAAASEPHHLILGRHFVASTYEATSGFPVPAGGINHCVGVVDTDASRIFLDLGNALPTGGATCAPAHLGELTLGVYNAAEGPPFAAGAITTLGKISRYTAKNWYEKTAGVVVLPLTSDQLESIAAAPLVLRSTRAAFISEWSCGAYVAADTFVYRLSPGDPANIPFYMTQWGQPVSGVTVSFNADPSQLQPPADGPPVAVPEDALQFNPSALTNADGIAVLQVTTTDPLSPRNFDGQYGIDGQVYGISPSLDPYTYSGPVDQWNFVSILLWSGFPASPPVTWNDIEPTMTQYANLYPVMSRFLDLGNYDSVVAHARLLKLAFGLRVSDPDSMPVTRDLSPAKRTAILSFLDDPQRGAVKESATTAPRVPAEGVTPAAPALKGKAAASARRLVRMKGRRS